MPKVLIQSTASLLVCIQGVEERDLMLVHMEDALLLLVLLLAEDLEDGRGHQAHLTVLTDEREICGLRSDRIENLEQFGTGVGGEPI
jgi:hypothetical protein